MSLTVAFAGPASTPNTASFEFSWSTWMASPRADLNYFPAVLSGRIDPLELRNTVESFNLYVDNAWKGYRRRIIAPVLVIPISIFLIIAASQLWRVAGSGYNGILWAGLALLVSSSVWAVAVGARHRRAFDAIVVGLRNEVARATARYQPYGMFWSVAVEERLVLNGRGRARTRPVIHLVIEVAPQPGMAPGGGMSAMPGMPWGTPVVGATAGTYPQQTPVGYASAPPQPGYYPPQMPAGAVPVGMPQQQQQQQQVAVGYSMDPSGSYGDGTGYAKI